MPGTSSILHSDELKQAIIDRIGSKEWDINIDELCHGLIHWSRLKKYLWGNYRIKDETLIKLMARIGISVKVVVELQPKTPEQIERIKKQLNNGKQSKEIDRPSTPVTGIEFYHK